MRITRSAWWWIALLGLLVVGVGVGMQSEASWREEVILEKIRGRLSDMSWTDLLAMLRPGSGFYLKSLIATPNPYEVIENPLRSADDVADGRRLFGAHCSSCHGEDARGGAGGPSLHDHVFRQGQRPWALYRTIRLGVPGTAMAGHRELSRRQVWLLVSYIQSIIGETPAGQKRDAVPFRSVTAADLRGASADPSEWLMYSGSYDGQRHSALSQINRASIQSLRVAWVRQLSDATTSLETTPIVRGSTMFVTETPGTVLALDATTGRVLWRYSRPSPGKVQLCCGAQNRGVAVLGTRVFLGTLDAHLLAIDARNGRLLWDVAVADGSHGYSITSAPLAVGDMVVTGVAGGEFNTRDFIDAYDAASGRRLWRFYTIPAPGEPGSGSWSGESWRNGGAPGWLTGSFDPELNLIYWGVGNPHPNFFGAKRRGDDLYSDSVVALDATTGKLRWYFQFTPHDLHDWDSAQTPVLVDAPFEGKLRKLLLWPNRNGFYYVLDRVSGKFLLAAPFVRQNWAAGIDASGRPRVRPESIPTRAGSLVYPGVTGATNWWATTYDPDLHLIFVPTLDRGSYFFSSPAPDVDAQGETLGSTTSMLPGERLVTSVRALEISTGRLVWTHSNAPRLSEGEMGGLVSTAGGIVFGGDLDTFFALDEATGQELWQFDAGAQIMAAPISYAIDGRQYVAVAAGRAIFAFSLPALRR